MPPKLKEWGERLSEKLKISRRRGKRHHRKFLWYNGKAQDADKIGDEADRKAKQLRKQHKPRRAAYQEAKAKRAHGRAGNRSDKAQWHRKQRTKWNRRQEELERRWNKFLKAKSEWYKDHPGESAGPKGPSGLPVWGSHEVAEGFPEILNKSQDKGWDGGVNSGYRTPEYSESLCYRICSQAFCAGLCAGRSSNHSKRTVAEGAAVDVSDYYEFGDIQDEIDVPIRVTNHLPYDPVHYSRTGY